MQLMFSAIHVKSSKPDDITVVSDTKPISSALPNINISLEKLYSILA